LPYVVEMPLDGGGSLRAEVAEDDLPAVERVGRPGQVVHRGAETLQDALGRLRPAIAAVVDHVRDMAEPPDRITLEFGIKVTGEAGLVVAKAAIEASFTVSVEWSRAPGPPPGPLRTVHARGYRNSMLDCPSSIGGLDDCRARLGGDHGCAQGAVDM
jgi:hypothetical protein